MGEWVSKRGYRGSRTARGRKRWTRRNSRNKMCMKHILDIVLESYLIGAREVVLEVYMAWYGTRLCGDENGGVSYPPSETAPVPIRRS